MTEKTGKKRKKKAAASKAATEPSAEEKAEAEDTRAQEIEEEGTRIETPPPEPPPRRAGSSRVVVWLALIVSLGALAGAGYVLFDNWRAGKAEKVADAALGSLNVTLDSTRESLNSLEQRLDSLAAKDVASIGELQSVERRLNERLTDFESLPGRIVNLEGSISSLQGISTGARDAWLLAEAEYYMQIANAQLQLAANPHLASLALRFADERLLQLADPALTEVRRVLSDELRAIEVMEKPDIEGVTLTLASLAGVVSSLPLRQEVRTPDEATDETEPELGGVDRALASLKKTVQGVVSVRRADEAVEPLVAPDAVYFLRANLALQLQAARLALLRNEQQIFVQSLDDASDWLARYYDTDSSPVQSALATIAEIRNGSFSVAPPDISESLRLLRQHVALSGSAAPPRIEPDE